MQVKDRLIAEVAEQLGLPRKKVLEVITAQMDLIKISIKEKRPRSIYLRKVGTFIPRAVKNSMKQQRINKKQNGKQTDKRNHED